MSRRVLSFFVMLLVFVGTVALVAAQANAESVLITDRSAVDGSDFTSSPVLAAKLNAIFDGNAGIYQNSSCTSLVDTYLGTSPVKNNGIHMYVGPAGGEALSIGTSCWIYANGVYHTLFGESTGGGTAGKNSEKLDISQTASRKLTYENFKAWGVRQGVGALIRASGHSMILLAYDADALTILDGNGDGNGLVSISKRSWDQFYSTVEYIIQPKEPYYAQLYACGMCGEDLRWSVSDAGTLTITGTGKLVSPAWQDYCNSIQKIVISGDFITIGDGVFENFQNLEQIVFDGRAPVISGNAFAGVTATVSYPISGKGWSAEMLRSYGGVLAWTPYGMAQLKITAQPQNSVAHSGTVAAVSVTAEGDGLAYTWYTKDPEESEYTKSDITAAAYSVKMSEKTKGRDVICIVTDQYGDCVISQRAVLQMCSCTDLCENTSITLDA